MRRGCFGLTNDGLLVYLALHRESMEKAVHQGKEEFRFLARGGREM